MNKKNILFFVDIIAVPLVYFSALLLGAIRKMGIANFPISKKVLLKVGMFPLSNHYYEPLFDHRGLKPLDQVRNLTGIDWNVSEQLALLGSFHYQQELKDVPTIKVDETTFYSENPSFGGGDAEYFYNLIRAKKPKRLFEIGSGNSTLMAIKAIKKNAEEDPNYKCKHVCVEPYEMPWLEQVGVEVVRQKVEEIGTAFFSELVENDILFIDSSHIIRPQGDVLFEYLELLPTLHAGVIVQVHDIFSPRDYPKKWIIDQVRMWNEQYLLEAFLTSNRNWKIIGAVNYLKHEYYSQLANNCPFLTRDREPGSFYVQRIS